MKKLLALILTLICLLSVMTSCNANTESSVPSGMTVLSEEGDEYNIYIPSEWTADTSMGIRAAYYTSTEYPDDLANISLIVFNGEESVESFWESNLESLKETFDDVEFLTEAEKTVVGNCEAIRYVYTATVTTKKYQYMQVAIYNGGYVYLFTYTALEEYYSNHYGDSDKDVNMILDNFSFK